MAGVQIPEGQKLYQVIRKEVLVYRTYVLAANGKEARAKLSHLAENTSIVGFECEESEDMVFEETNPWMIEHLTERDIDDVELPEGWEEEWEENEGE